MDDKQKDTVAGGGIGALVGGAVGGPPGAALGGLAGAVLGGHERKHNQALRDSFYTLRDGTNGRARLYVDHIDPEGAEPGSPKNRIKSVSGIPDLICIAQHYPNLIVEVETVTSVTEHSNHVIQQLNDFQARGFKRVLVVPEGDVQQCLEWCEKHENEGNIEKEVNLTTPGSIGGVL